MNKLLPFEGSKGLIPSGELNFEVGRIAAPPLTPTRQIDKATLLGSSQVWTNAGSSSARSGRASTIETTSSGAAAATLEVRLFDARSTAKMIAARLSMHLSVTWRSKVYKQLDELLDAAEWTVDDNLLNANSMQSFLRFVIYAEVTSVPSLGISPGGNVIAAWWQAHRRVTIEFQPDDRCLAVLTERVDDEQSLLTFAGPTARAREFLQREQFALS